MVATLARLRFRLLRNSLVREKWRIILLVIGAIYALGLVVAVVAVALALSFATDPQIRAEALVLAGSLLVIGWIAIPLLAFGLDDTLDPQRFALFVPPSRKLALGLLVGGAVSIPGIATVLVCLAVALAWLGSGPAAAGSTPGPGAQTLAVVFALIGGLLGAALCFLLARVVTTAASGVLRGRRGREIAGILTFALVMLAAFTPTLAQSVSIEFSRDPLTNVASVLAWTPFGAPWALPADALAGDWLALAARLAVILATLTLGFLAYVALLRRSMTTVGSGGGPSAARTSRLPLAHRLIAWFGLGGGTGVVVVGTETNDAENRSPLGLPLTRGTAAVAGRSARYWRADPRYLMAAGSVVLMPLVAFLLAYSVGSGGDVPLREALGWAALAVAPIAAWFGSWGLSNDVATDSTAFALHVTSGVTGREDRLGRVLGASAWLVPLCLLFAIGAPAAFGRIAYVPAVLGLTLGILGAGFGTSSVASVLVPYPAVPPGANPMSTQQGAGMLGALAQVGAFFGMGVPMIPTLLTLIPVFAVGPQWGWLTLAVGLATGLAALALGVRWGGQLYETRQVAVLERIQSWPNH